MIYIIKKNKIIFMRESAHETKPIILFWDKDTHVWL